VGDAVAARATRSGAGAGEAVDAPVPSAAAAALRMLPLRFACGRDAAGCAFETGDGADAPSAFIAAETPPCSSR
jgi:hypothetical protein